MSFAIIHRDVKWEWEKSLWKSLIYLYSWNVGCSSSLLEDEGTYFILYKIALEYLGAYELQEHRSLMDCSLGLLHMLYCLNFSYARIIEMVTEDG